MTKSIMHIRYSRLLMQVSDILLSIHNLNIDISVCNKELMACLEDPSMVIERAALKQYIVDRQQQIITLNLQAAHLREEGRMIRQMRDVPDYPEFSFYHSS